MTDVVLVRHAIAETRDPARWPDDAERPLTADGTARFLRAARGLRRILPGVDVVLSSPYARAWRTAEILHDEAGWPAAERCEPLAASEQPAAAIRLLRERPLERAIALVGHEPYLSSLASLLLAGATDALRLDLKKGGAVLLALDADPTPGTAVLRWSATPKMLRRLGRA